MENGVLIAMLLIGQFLVMLALLAVVYGLVNRLLRQSGQHRLRPQEAMPEMFTPAPVSPDGKIEPAGKVVRESFRITP